MILFAADAPEVIAKIRANPENPPAHLIFLSDFQIPDVIKWGLLDKMSLKTVPNLKDVKPIEYNRFNSYAVTQNYSTIGIMYNKKKIKNPPKTWLEAVDRVIKGEFGKRVSFPSITFQAGGDFLWVIGHELGDSLEKMDRVFEKVRLMKPFIPKFWTSQSECFKLIEAGEVDIIFAYDHRGWKFIDQGHEDWDIQILAPVLKGDTQVAKVKNAHPIIFDLLNFILDAENQSKWSSEMNCHPVNIKSRTNPTLQGRYDRTIPKGEILYTPYAEISKNRSQWMERWNKEIGG